MEDYSEKVKCSEANDEQLVESVGGHFYDREIFHEYSVLQFNFGSWW